jgi:arginase
MREIVVLEAPSNLGLRPPAPDTVPGCYKLAGALRDTPAWRRLPHVPAGVVVPPRYVGTWAPGDGVRNRDALATYTRALAERVDAVARADSFVLLLGGDCSIVLGAALALRRRGRYALVHVDAHSDFRHQGNAPHVGAAAGEDLALVTGRGDPALTDIDGLAPYVADGDVAQLGVREPDEYLAEMRGTLGTVVTSGELRSWGVEAAARGALSRFDERGVDGFWVQVDADVLDSSLMPAVDTPEPDGLTFDELGELLRTLVFAPGAVGLSVTIYDPDLDPSGRHARELADVLVDALLASTGADAVTATAR